MILTILFWLGFVLYILASFVLILVVLVQSGKGGGLSGLVGAGSAISDHLGATGAEKTLTRWTTYCAIGFLILNILLVLMGGKIFVSESIADKIPVSDQAPAAVPGATAQPPAGPPAEAPGQPPAPAAAQPASAPVAAPAAQPVPAQPPAAAQPPVAPAAAAPANP